MKERLRNARRFLEEAATSYDSVPSRGTPSLAQDALIAAIDPSTGKIWNKAAFAVPCALLLELAREGRLDVSGTGRKTRLALRDATPLGDPELDEAMLVIGSGLLGQKATRLVEVVPGTDKLVARLVAEGVIVEESHRRLGMFTVRRYRPAQPARRDELVARLRSALLGESIPDERTALLISALVDVHFKLFVPGSKVGQAHRRAREIRERIGADERAIRSAVAAAVSNASDSGSSI